MKLNFKVLFIVAYLISLLGIILSGFFPVCILYFITSIFIILIFIKYYLRCPLFRSHCKRKAKREINKIEQLYLKEDKKETVLNYLTNMNSFIFQEVILSAFERNGYQLIRNKRCNNDGIIDGRVIIEGDVWVIKSKKDFCYLEHSHIQEFMYILSIDKFKGLSSGIGIFIHTGKISKELYDFYSNSNLIILSGVTLLDFICSSDNKILSSF